MCTVTMAIMQQASRSCRLQQAGQVQIGLGAEDKIWTMCRPLYRGMATQAQNLRRVLSGHGHLGTILMKMAVL